MFQFAALLSLFTGAFAASAADYYVGSLPGQPDGPLLRMHAGHIEITPEHHGNLWFWSFENRHLANKHRTVIWFNGGPGCSSLDGALLEIGPYRLSSDHQLIYNEGSWDEFANLLFVDQPVGTGYSYVDTDSYVKSLPDMASDIIKFLDKYFAIFPEQASDDIYLAGESFAGQYIPYIARAILDRNKDQASARPWNLKGAMIGNGWISSKDQSTAYLEYAYKANMIQKGTDAARQLDQLQIACQGQIDQAKDDESVAYTICESILQKILNFATKNGNCPNMYDVRLTDTACGMNWPMELVYMKPWLRSQEVLSALHVNPDKTTGWVECAGNVGKALRGQSSRPSSQLLPGLLEEIPILLFSGDQDLICNHMGTESLIHNMEWNGGKGFEISPGTWAPRRDWVFEGEPAGFWQEARNLTYVLFYNSSHMVPVDYPRRTRDMFDRFAGVDIASIGGKPTDSRIDGEQGPQTSVGNGNNTTGNNGLKSKLSEERWSAYRRSGAIALVVVIILAGFFGWYVVRDRRRRAGYTGLMGGRGTGNPSGRGDLEAGDFDVEELEDLKIPRPGAQSNGVVENDGERRYSLGGFSSDEDDITHGSGKDKGKGKATL